MKNNMEVPQNLKIELLYNSVPVLNIYLKKWNSYLEEIFVPHVCYSIIYSNQDTEDEMIGWHHSVSKLNGHEFEQAPDGEG